MPRKIIIDTDPGVDDLLATLLALASPEVEVIGLTTVFGNVDADLTTANALAILEVAGRTGIPVARGASGPLVGAFNGGVPHIHGVSGLGDNPTSRPATTVIPLDAADFIVRQVEAAPGEVTLFAIGPLTNIAEAARRDPDLPFRVHELVIMGGNAYVPGNLTPTAEANIFQDPEAAASVLNLGWPMTMVGLDVTDQVTLTPEQIDRIGAGSTPLDHMLTAAMAGYQRFHETAIPGYRGLCPHDATALCWLLQPDLFEAVSRTIRVETTGANRGKTWPGQPDDPAGIRPPVTVPIRVKAQEAAALMCDRLSAFTAG